MFLKSFRDLLDKKIVNEELKKTLYNTTDSTLIDYVIETLEKMASHKNRQSNPNLSLSDFISKIDPDTDNAEAHYIRDAIGHHASHYKAALKAGNQQLANSHAKQFVKLCQLADKIDRAPGGREKLKFDAPDLKPWQLNRPSLFVNNSASKNRSINGIKVDPTGWKSHDKKDFSWLQEPPHASASSEIFKSPHKTISNPDGTVEHLFHNGAYPMEHVKINGKYIPINDNADVSHGFYTEHPFDMHPIMSTYLQSGDKNSSNYHSPEKAAAYQEMISKFHDGIYGQNLLAKLGTFIDPEHGSSPGSTVHKPVANPLQKPQDRASQASIDNIASSEEQKHNENISSLLADLGLGNSNSDEEK